MQIVDYGGLCYPTCVDGTCSLRRHELHCNVPGECQMSAPEDYDADASKDEGLDEPKRRPRTDLSRRGELEYQTIGPLPEVPAPSGVRFDIPCHHSAAI